MPECNNILQIRASNIIKKLLVSQCPRFGISRRKKVKNNNEIYSCVVILQITGLLSTGR